jgi:chaperonin GroEL
MLGQARRVISTKENTTIVEGKGEKSEIEKRIASIKKEMQEATNDFDKEKLQERLAKLSGGVGVIKVGAATEVEQKAKQHKLEDALHATKCAVEEGIVPGGGVALLRTLPALENVQAEGDEKTGVNILKRAIEEPIRQIAENAGIDGAVVVQKVKEGQGEFGFNAGTMVYEDLIKAGVVDPTKVTRTALENAVSAASMLLTTEAIISELPKKECCQKSNAPNPIMGGDY